MKRIFGITGLALVIASGSAQAEGPNGCEHQGETYPVGHLQLMNGDEIAAREAKGEFVGNGEAVFALCSFLVDTNASEWPQKENRRFVWVAGGIGLELAASK